MLSTELEYLCTEFEYFLQCWNAFDRVGIPLYRDRMLCAGLECFLQVWNAFYRIGMLSTWLECFLHGWNAFYRCYVGRLSTWTRRRIASGMATICLHILIAYSKEPQGPTINLRKFELKTLRSNKDLFYESIF
jgi:hypothetical protein